MKNQNDPPCVAAYCRVSMCGLPHVTACELQQNYYRERIERNRERIERQLQWKLTEIYSEEKEEESTEK